MVSFNQSTLYIMAAIIILVVIILLAVFMRRRGSKNDSYNINQYLKEETKEPSNINRYLKEEAENKKAEIVERVEGIKKEKPLYKLGPEDDLESIRETTTKLQHKNAYYSSKVEDKLERLDHQEKQVKIQKQIKTIKQKETALNSVIKPKGK